VVRKQLRRCNGPAPFAKPLIGAFYLKFKGADGPLLFFWGEGPVEMRDALMRLLEPPIEALGYELVDLEFAREGRGGVLRIYIDRAAGEPVAGAGEAGGMQAGITVDDCASVSHAVSQILDTQDPIKGHYTLEVSSPGSDRILRTRAHFDRFAGERVFAELKLPLDGRRRFVGTLKAVSDDAIVVEVDGKAYSLPLDRIQKARLRPE
jgi:ribosome maturation factor RimP